ncbi:MAG: hypothetical protein ACI91T_001426, partial [Natronomonas sp.]
GPPDGYEEGFPCLGLVSEILSRRRASRALYWGFNFWCLGVSSQIATLLDGRLVGRRVAVVDGFAVALPVQSLREVLDRPVEGRFS